MALEKAWLLLHFMFIALSALQTNAATALNPTMGAALPRGCEKKMIWDPKQQKTNALENSPLSDRLILFNNVFRADKTDPMKSSQKTACSSFRDGVLSWTTTFSITSIKGAEDEVKSYPNVLWKPALQPKFRQLKSIQARWDWAIEGRKDPLKCVVFFRMLASKRAGCTIPGDVCAQTIVRVWLANIGRKPRGKKTPIPPILLKSSDGQKTYKFDLWVITGQIQTYSLIPSEDNVSYEIFDSDLLSALKAIKSQGFKFDDLVLQELTAGVEPFLGEATLRTKTFTLTIG